MTTTTKPITTTDRPAPACPACGYDGRFSADVEGFAWVFFEWDDDGSVMIDELRVEETDEKRILCGNCDAEVEITAYGRLELVVATTTPRPTITFHKHSEADIYAIHNEGDETDAEICREYIGSKPGAYVLHIYAELDIVVLTLNADNLRVILAKIDELNATL